MTLSEIIKLKQVIIACQPVFIEQLVLEWIVAHAGPSSKLHVTMQLSREANGQIKIDGMEVKNDARNI